jgi:hypothetical protein
MLARDNDGLWHEATPDPEAALYVTSTCGNTFRLTGATDELELLPEDEPRCTCVPSNGSSG